MLKTFLKKIYIHIVKKYFFNKSPFGLIFYKKPILNRKNFYPQFNYYPPARQEKIIQFWNILNYVRSEKVNGDIVECGVGFGSSLTIIGNMAEKLKIDKNIHAFDSFSGFPIEDEKDKSSFLPSLRGYDITNVEHVKNHFKYFKLDNLLDKRVFFHPGYFENTIPENKLSQISVLHLDCDLYQSYKVCFKFLAPKVSNDGLIILDEYNEKKWPGASIAIDEFLKDSDLVLLHSPITAKHIIVKSTLLNSNSENFNILKNSLQLVKI